MFKTVVCCHLNAVQVVAAAVAITAALGATNSGKGKDGYDDHS
jgi:hypothetical protein